MGIFEDFANPFKLPEIGTTVRLNSGGPEMTISKHVEDKCLCTWHGTEGTLQSALFDRRTFVVINAAEKKKT